MVTTLSCFKSQGGLLLLRRKSLGIPLLIIAPNVTLLHSHYAKLAKYEPLPIPNHHYESHKSIFVLSQTTCVKH